MSLIRTWEGVLQIPLSTSFLEDEVRVEVLGPGVGKVHIEVASEVQFP
jgi:hypothetical protein